MKIVDRYIVKGFLGPFIWCLFAFILTAIIIDIFTFIDDIVKYKIPLPGIFAFYVYYCPTIFIQVTPMAMLLSTIYLLSNLNKHNEIIALKSGGISLWRVIAPLFIIGLVVSGVVFLVNDKVIPISSRVSNVIRRDELEIAKEAGQQRKVLDNVAIYGAGNRLVFARSYDVDKRLLRDIIVHEQDRNDNLVLKITAQSAEWSPRGWRFFKGVMYKIDNSGRVIGSPSFFDEKIVALKERPSDFANREWKSEYMSYSELSRYINNFKAGGTKLVNTLLVDLHYKVSFVFINIIIVLIGAPFALITTRGGVLIGVGMSIAIGLLYYGVIAVSVALGKAGIFPPLIAAWFGNIIFAALGIHLINKRT